VGNDGLAPRPGFSETWTPPNKRMHATADTRDAIKSRGARRRVMRGVMLLRIMTEEISTHRRAYQAALAIGSVGAFGQAALLWHTLVNSYPYKMMSFPVVLCPVFFWCVYKAAFLLRELRGNLEVGSNFDGTTPAMVEQEFAYYALSLGVAGLCVGMVCGLVLWLLFKSKQNTYR
jgi:hypothetical protein